MPDEEIRPSPRDSDFEEGYVSVLMLAMHVCEFPQLSREEILPILGDVALSASLPDLWAAAHDESCTFGERTFCVIAYMLRSEDLPMASVRATLSAMLAHPDVQQLQEFPEAMRRLDAGLVTQ